MKVPEKIYRHQTTGNPKLNLMYHEYKPAKIRYDDKIIEYIRKDAFIWKACKWLRNNSHNYANNALGKEYLVNDFVNYMKGE